MEVEPLPAAPTGRADPTPQPLHKAATRTYGRKHVEAAEGEAQHESLASTSSLSSLPSSPAPQLFDKPLKKPSAGSECDSQDENADDTACNTDVSPEHRDHAKFGGNSLNTVRKRGLQRVESAASDSSTSSLSAFAIPVIGLARRIMDDSDDDAADEDDDDVAIAKVRGPPAHDQPDQVSPESDPFTTSSLSSAPVLSSQADAERGSYRGSDHANYSSGSSQMPARSNKRTRMLPQSDSTTLDDDDEDRGQVDSANSDTDTAADQTIRQSTDSASDDQGPVRQRGFKLPSRRGAKVSAMKGKGGKKLAVGSDDSDAEADMAAARKSKVFKLVSSSSIDDGEPIDAQASASKTGLTRKQKMDALAASRRRHAGEEYAQEVGDVEEGHAQSGSSTNLNGMRSRSISIEDDRLDDNQAAGSPSFGRSRQLGLAQDVRELNADLDDSDLAVPQRAKGRASKPKKSKMTEPKPLSKKEQESMFRETERLKREHRARLAPTEKHMFRLNDLLGKISNGDQNGGGSFGSRQSTATPKGPAHREAEHHASDPIESDPIRDRSSPASSPIVGIARSDAHGGAPAAQRGLDILGLRSTSQIHAVSYAPEASHTRERGHGPGVSAAKTAAQSDSDDDAVPETSSQLVAKVAAKKAREAQLQLMHRRKLEVLAARGQGIVPAPIPKPATAKEGVPVNKIAAGQNTDDGDDDDLEIEDREASGRRMPPQTPGRQRPSDSILREVGIKPTRTPRQRKAGTDAFGSPGVDLGSSPDRAGALEDGQSDDENIITDSQLREAGKAFQPNRSGGTPARRREARDRRRGPAPLTTEEFRATLMRKAQAQNMEVRLKKEAQAKRAGHSSARDALDGLEVDSTAQSHDVQAMIDRLRTAKDQDRDGPDADGDDDVEDEDDPDFLIPAAEDVEDAIGSGSEIGGDRPLGSGSEVDENGDDDDVDSDRGDEAQRDVVDDEDSEKENAPPAAQPASRINFFGSPTSSQRSLQPSRAVMDEDEDDAPGPRATSRRRRRAALAEDDDDDLGRQAQSQGENDSDDESRLRPGRVLAATSSGPSREFNTVNESQSRAHSQSQSQERVVLGDISAESLGHLSQPTQSVDSRRIPPVQLAQDEESFRTDDISVGGFTQLFSPTQGPNAATGAQVFAQQAKASQAPNDIWNATQTQASQDPTHSQATQSARKDGSLAGAHHGLAHVDSANSALGAFFEDTQSQMPNESMDIFANPKNKDGMAKGFTQFFGSTPVAGSAKGDAEGRPEVSDESQSQSQWDADRFSMPPPRSTVGFDGFAALRKAQMGEAMNLTPTPSLLPTLDESQAEREAEAARLHDGGSNDTARAPAEKKMYFNKDGFFTQTKPSTQQAAEWGIASQGQTQLHTPLKVASSSVGERTPLSPSMRGAGGQVHSGSSSDADEIGADATKPRQLKRLRRGRVLQSDVDEDEEDEDIGELSRAEVGDESDDEGILPVGGNQALVDGAARNAFDVLRSGAARAAPPSFAHVAGSKKKRKSNLIEGEAEESSDEEFGGRRRGDKSGLGRVFSDDEHGSGSDENSDDEDDGQDLAELVDDERDADEADKDRRALEAHQAHMAEQDKQLQSIHEKATRGDLRRRMKGRDGNGLDAFLDEDADDEDLKRRAMGPRGPAFKKRQLEGDRDEMDELRQMGEAKAFVDVYEVSHKPGEDGDYSFLAGQDDEEDDDHDSDEDDGEDATDDQDEVQTEGRDEDETLEDAINGESASKRRKGKGQDDVVTHSGLIRELHRRRLAKRRRGGFIDSDEEGDGGDDVDSEAAAAAEAKRLRRLEDPDYSSDEDENERRVAQALRNRVEEQRRQVAEAAEKKARAAPGRKTLGTTSRINTYGKSKSKSKAGGIASMLQSRSVSGGDAATPQPSSQSAAAPSAGTHDSAPEAVGVVDHEEDEDDEDDEDEPMSADIHLLLDARQRLASSSALASSNAQQKVAAGGAAEEDEPDWGNDGSLYRMTSRPAAATSSTSSAAASRTPSGAWKRKSTADAPGSAEKRRQQPDARKPSVLFDKKLMSRETQFQESL